MRKLRGRLMPPPGNVQPDDEELWSFVHWLEGYLDDYEGLTPLPQAVPTQGPPGAPASRWSYRHRCACPQ